MAKHHFVPRFYLKGFVDPSSKGSRNPYLWVVDLQNKTVKRRAPKNVARITRFYDLVELRNEAPSVEALLSQIESRAAPVISRLRSNNFHMTLEDRLNLSYFLGLQITRIPSSKKLLENRMTRFAQNQLRELAQDEKILEKFTIRPTSDHVLVATLEAARKFAEIIFIEMYWLFLIPTERANFLTSDHPVSTGKAAQVDFGGKRIPEFEIAFPISPSCFLLLHQYEWKGVVEGVDFLDADQVDKVNRLMLRTADRYVFCSNEQQGKWALEQHQPLQPTPKNEHV